MIRKALAIAVAVVATSGVGFTAAPAFAAPVMMMHHHHHHHQVCHSWWSHHHRHTVCHWV